MDRPKADSMADAVEAEANWSRRLLIGGGIAVAIVVAVLLASAAVPRWWAQRIGERVDGSITQGVLVGLLVPPRLPRQRARGATSG